MKIKSGKTNYKRLIPFIEKVNENGGYAKFTANGYMDLVIENIGYNDFEGNPVYSIAHYGEMNGDAMRDPEITFSVNEAEKSILPLSFRNDYMGMNVEYFRNQNGRISYLSTWLHDGDQFLQTWTQNIIDQGFTPERSLVLNW